MWKKPWGYKEGFAICAGLFVTGTLLQITIGKTNLDLLAFPVNIMILFLFLSALVVMGFSSAKIYLFRWMSSYHAAVSSMAAVVIMIVFMGLIRQLQPQVHIPGIKGWLGFSQMLSAWSFSLVLCWFLVVLGMTILRRARGFRLRDIPFLLNHSGLFIALVAGILGSADLQRLELTARKGKAEWRAFTRDREMIELPLAIELHDFTIDEYPPKLILIDHETSKALPEGKPVNLLVEDDLVQGQLADWKIDIIQRIPQAAGMVTADTIRFVEFHSMGATYALYLKAENIHTGEQAEGWVSCGSFMFPYKAIRLNQDISLIMPDREPRRYASDITIFTRSGRSEDATIEVNNPFKMDGWKIYQVSYDEHKGRWSDISVFELVKDPWQPAVYAGVWMMIAGAVCLFSLAPKRKEDGL